MDMRHKDKCGVDDTDIRFCMEEHDVAAKYNARNMKVNPNNHTRWKHTWGWHSRGCVWDKTASEWSGKEKRCNKRNKCQKAEGHERLRDTCDAECKTPSRTQAENQRRCKTRQREETAKDTGTARRIDFTSH